MNKILLLVALCACAKTNSEAATDGAREYMKHVPGATGYECVATDSDGDGYCSCTIFVGSAEPQQIQCGCERICVWNCARGCKSVQNIKFSGPTSR